MLSSFTIIMALQYVLQPVKDHASKRCSPQEVHKILSPLRQKCTRDSKTKLSRLGIKSKRLKPKIDGSINLSQQWIRLLINNATETSQERPMSMKHQMSNSMW